MATIKERENGAWQAVIRRKGYPHLSRTFDTWNEAIAWAADEDSKILNGKFKDLRKAQDTTLWQVLSYYRDNHLWKNKGREADIVRLNVLLNSGLAKYKMTALDSNIIEDWCSQYMAENKVKGSTINRYLNLLSAAINLGIKKMNLNIENPIRRVDRPANPEHRDRRIFGEEERRLFAALSPSKREGGRFMGPQNSWVRPLVEFALETGMRRSEILGLEWQFVDKVTGIAHIPDTKSGKGDGVPVSRDVPLSKRALEILEELPREIEGRVFSLSSESIKKAFARAVGRARKTYEAECKEAGETPLARMLVDLRFHDLRHEATSRLAKVYDIKQLSKVGGWRNLNTLARYYNPTAMELVQKLREHEKQKGLK
ncbi:MAG: site-specific integrase [Methylobacillus sp.]|nr:site-specific integrase [Methylobacillus sp.]